MRVLPAFFTCAAMLFALGCVHTRLELLMVPNSKSNWSAIKYNPRTGESWRVRDGAWLKLKENEPVLPSRYTVKMVPIHDDWRAVRMDTKTGRSWRVRDGAWQEIPETQNAP